MTLDPQLASQFREVGFAGPIPLLDRQRCQTVLRGAEACPPPAVWAKGHAVSSRSFYEAATEPRLLDFLDSLIGPDIMLWGASLVRRQPGQVHHWHTDLETASPVGRSVTVWIGLQHTNRRSALRAISHSHRFGASLQQVAFESQNAGRRVTTQDVLRWAHARDRRSRLVEFDVGDGDALLFDGRLWHGSENRNWRGARTALLLQYATPDVPIRMPDPGGPAGWPRRFLPTRAPCILVRGVDRGKENHMVSRPTPTTSSSVPARAPDADPLWPSWIRPLTLPLTENPALGWQSQSIFRGSTPAMKDFSSHVTLLSAGKTPHPPHAHAQEELIVLLSGAVDIITVEAGPDERRARMEAGSMAYHPAHQRHTIHGAGPGPATYVVLRWSGDDVPTPGRALASSIHRFARATPRRRVPRVTSVPILDSPTRYLHTLHCHVSSVPPGGGYSPHRDAHDVALIVLSGTLETLGRRVRPHDVVFCAARQSHGLENVGRVPATYLVVEFHGGDHAPRFTKRSLPRRGYAYARATAQTLLWRGRSVYWALARDRGERPD